MTAVGLTAGFARVFRMQGGPNARKARWKWKHQGGPYANNFGMVQNAPQNAY